MSATWASAPHHVRDGEGLATENQDASFLSHSDIHVKRFKMRMDLYRYLLGKGDLCDAREVFKQLVRPRRVRM